MSIEVLDNKHEYNKEDIWWRDQIGLVKSSHTASSAALYHRKNPDEKTIGDNEIIADAKNALVLHITWGKEHKSFRFHFKSCEITMPYGFHLAAAINEMIKQEEHVSKWFKKEYLIAKRKYNFSYRNWKVCQSKVLGEND